MSWLLLITSPDLWAFASKNDNAASVVNALTTAFPEKTKKPEKLITDNGKPYISSELKKFCHNRKITHAFTTTYHPQTNGMVERVNGTIKTRLKIAIKEKPNIKWSTHLSEIVKQYNETMHSVTGFSPAYLFKGQSSYELTPLQDAHQLAIKRTEAYKKRYKKYYDKRHKHIEFVPGDKVKFKIPSNLPTKNKFTSTFSGPHTVVSKDSDLNYTILDHDTQKQRRVHLNQLEPYYQRDYKRWTPTNYKDPGKC